jgi:hypothetical protein
MPASASLKFLAEGKDGRYYSKKRSKTLGKRKKKKKR